MTLGGYASAQEDPAVRDLRKEIEGWIKSVETHQKHLPAPQSPAANKLAFQKYQEFYTEIAKKLTSYTKTKRHKYYDYLRRSENRSMAAKEVVNTARKTAKLFERYQKRPATYSQVESELGLYYLLIELTNLRDFS